MQESEIKPKSELELKKEIVRKFIEKGIMVNKNLLEKINKISDLREFIENLEENITKLHEEALSHEQDLSEQKISDQKLEVKKEERERRQVKEGNVEILFSYKAEPKKREVGDFVSFFSSRYSLLKKILMNRKDFSGLTSISKLSSNQERDSISIIGMISEKFTTKNENILLKVEDPTGEIRVLVSKSKPELTEIAKDCVLDEVVGIIGKVRDNMLFVDELILPDIPVYKELKKSPEESYALFMGDLHFGSKFFLKNEFEKFLNWIRGEHGTEAQREIVEKIKYLFIVGDLVEGVGIYPDQERDLEIKDIYEQYSEFANYLKKIPSWIKIIIIPGNHDAMRMAEPQPPLYKDFAEAVYKLPNVIMTSNPSIVNIDKTPDFPGFDILMYHGFSFTYYADSVDSIRSKGGQSRVDLIMQFLLQRRHLAPTHSSTLYLPDADHDNLVIEKIPDFFITGHIHRVSATSYRNVTMLNCSCWLSTTEFQEKMGLKPQPGRAVLVNLQSRKVKILKFIEEQNEQ